ncbi:MAG: anti-sigma factor [Synechococcales cyanobacterium RM1_1_8]|nr:anti-sigma factor [Synechococcales cyanobacterium RM1_1_8]
MSNSVTPEELQAIAAGYVLNELTPEETAQLERLRQNPANLAALNAEIEQMEQALEGSLLEAEIAPPAALKNAVLASFAIAHPALAPSPSPNQNQNQNQNPKPSSDSIRTLGSESDASNFQPRKRGLITPEKVTLKPPLLPGWAKWAGAVAAAIIVALALSNYALWRSLQSQRLQLAQLSAPPLSTSEKLTLSLQTTELLNNTHAQAEQVKALVEISPAELTGKLTLENLPPLQPGQVYVLWTVLDPAAPFTTDPKGAILTQVFTVNGEGPQSQSLNLPLAFQQAPNQVRAMAITIEDAAAPQGHQAAPILIQEL